MPCPDPDAINAVVEGSAGRDAHRRLEEHLDVCDHCRRLVAELIRASQRSEVSGRSLHQRSTMEPGSRIGRFIVIESIGEGGMGAVYAAYDPELDRKIALKVVHPELQAQFPERARLRTLREAQALARLSHPNVVAIFDVQEWETSIVIAMEFIDGYNLEDWLHQQPRSWIEIVDAFIAAARGLAAAHEAGLVHRDFKPKNVLMGTDGRLRVVDFGLACGQQDQPSTDSTDPAVRRDSPLGTPLTRTGMLLGTPGFMSPEQRLGEPVTPAADVYSFCLSLLQALRGRVATAEFSAKREILAATSALPLGARSRMRALLRRGLAERPGDRFSTMVAVANGLAAVPATSRLVRKVASWSILLSLLASVFGLIYVAWDRGRQRDLATTATQAYAQGRFFEAADALSQLYTRNPDSLTARYLLPKALLRAPQVPLLARDMRAGISDLTISPSGRTLAVASHDGWTRLWDLESKNELARIGPHPQWMRVAFSPDERFLLTSGWLPGPFKVWRLSDRKVTCEDGGALDAFGFTFDGTYLLVLTSFNRIGVWDRKECRQVKEIRTHEAIDAASLAQTQNRIVVAHDDHTLSVWDFDQDKMVWRASGHEASISSVAFSADDQRVVSVSLNGTLRVWDGASGQQLAVLRGGPASIHMSGDFHGPARRAISGGGNQGLVTVWPELPSTLEKILPWSPLIRFQPWLLQRASLEASGRQELLALYSMGRFGVFRTPPPDTLVLPNDAPIAGGLSAAFHPEGRHLAVGSLDRRVLLWDLQTTTYSLLEKEAWRISFSPNGSYLLTVGFGAPEALLWSETGKPIAALSHQDVFDGSFSRTGHEIVTAGMDGMVRIWDGRTGAPLRKFCASTPVSAVAFSPDGTKILVAASLALELWDSQTGRLIRRIGSHRQGMNDVMFSPSGELALSTSWDDTAILWRIRDGKKLRTFHHQDQVMGGSFHPSEPLIATTSSDGFARIWDITTGDPIMKFESNGYVAQFSPDGRRIVVSDPTGVRVHQMMPEERSPQQVARIVDGMRKLLD